MVRPFGPSRECRHVPMDLQNLGYLSFSASFASRAFMRRRERARARARESRLDRIMIGREK